MINDLVTMRKYFILLGLVWVWSCDSVQDSDAPREEFIAATTSNYTINAIYIQAFWSKGVSERVRVAAHTRSGNGPPILIPFAEVEPANQLPAHGVVRGDTIRFRVENKSGFQLAEIKTQYQRFGGEDAGCVSPGQIIFEERSTGYQLWTRIGCGYFGQ